MQRPFILILIAFISGILTGSYFTPCACLLLSATVIILAGILISLKKKWLRITWILLIGFAFIAGFFNIQKQDYLSDAAPSVSNYIDQGKVTVEAFVIDTSASSPEQEVLIVNSIRLLREKEYLPVSGKIKLIIPTDSNFEYGDFIRFHATLKKSIHLIIPAHTALFVFHTGREWMLPDTFRISPASFFCERKQVTL